MEQEQQAGTGPLERPVRRLDDGLPADAVRFAGDAPQMRVCRMDDLEWWIGESLAACVAEGRVGTCSVRQDRQESRRPPA